MSEAELEQRIKDARKKKIQSVMVGSFQLARPRWRYDEQSDAIVPRHFFRQSHLRVLCERQFVKMNEMDRDM